MPAPWSAGWRPAPGSTGRTPRRARLRLWSTKRRNQRRPRGSFRWSSALWPRRLRSEGVPICSPELPAQTSTRRRVAPMKKPPQGRLGQQNRGQQATHGQSVSPQSTVTLARHFALVCDSICCLRVTRKFTRFEFQHALCDEAFQIFLTRCPSPSSYPLSF